MPELVITIVVGILVGICILFCVGVFCLRSNKKRRDKLRPFTQNYIAHRGVYDNKEIPENSVKAFETAIAYGYCIELDVRLTKDDVPVVFHDATLVRMCGVDKRVCDCSYEELCSYVLVGTEEKILTFREVLKAIDGRVPVLVEIKGDYAYKKIAAKAAGVLDGYKGVYAVQSFHPLVLVWFRKQRPWVLRGQLSTDYWCDHISCIALQKVVRTDLWCNIVTCPDFVSFRHTMAGLWTFRLCRWLYKTPVFGWTIRSEEELALAKKRFDGIIFDGFLPKEKK